MSSLSLRHSSVLNHKSLGLVRRVMTWTETRRTRIALARLDRHLLADIGIEATTADREIRRPFWDL